MVAAVSPLLSDAKPKLAKRAGLGDRFHYWRGASGRRYLFSAVPPEALSDFTSAIVLLAEPTGNGGMAASRIAMVDSLGQLVEDDAAGAHISPSAVALVHLLASTDGERRQIMADMSAAAVRLAA